MYTFASWEVWNSALGGVQHTENGTTMEDLGCYALWWARDFFMKVEECIAQLARLL